MSTYLLDIIIVEYTTYLKDVIIIMYNNVIHKTLFIRDHVTTSSL